MSANPFHQHLDVCTQCRNHPFNLCEEGVRLLRGSAKMVHFGQVAWRAGSAPLSDQPKTRSRCTRP